MVMEFELLRFITVFTSLTTINNDVNYCYESYFNALKFSHVNMLLRVRKLPRISLETNVSYFNKVCSKQMHIC